MVWDGVWVDHRGLSSPENRIFNIEDYPTWDVEIDFNHPEDSQPALQSIVLKVEEECPVSKAFGHSGIGEGVVFVGEYKGVLHRFKVKGEKHSVTKVKTLANVDVEKVNSAREFAEKTVTKNRVDQACKNVCPGGFDIKKTGDVIRWVLNDIIKEESDTMRESGLEVKDVSSYIGAATRKIYMEM